MTDCRECGTTIPDSSNFCPSCGAPQNEAAARALAKYTKRRMEEFSEQQRGQERHTSRGRSADTAQFWNRVSYALAWIAIVAGLAIFPAAASGFVVFGGVVALPPVRRLLGRTLGDTPGIRPILTISLTSIVIGIALFLVA